MATQAAKKQGESRSRRHLERQTRCAAFDLFILSNSTHMTHPGGDSPERQKAGRVPGSVGARMGVPVTGDGFLLG